MCLKIRFSVISVGPIKLCLIQRCHFSYFLFKDFLLLSDFSVELFCSCVTVMPTFYHGDVGSNSTTGTVKTKIGHWDSPLHRRCPNSPAGSELKTSDVIKNVNKRLGLYFSGLFAT